MKKIFFASLIAALLGSAAFNVSAGQNSSSQPSSAAEYSSFGDPARGAFTPALINEINAKAQRNFARDYKNVAGADWYKLKDGSVVYFTEEGHSVRVAYDKKGNYLWTIREYTEDKLSAEIRELVRSRFYDFNIFYISEVKTARGIVYMMKLEGKATWKMIKVADGEITVLNDYIKK